MNTAIKIGIPTLAIIISILFDRGNMKRLSASITGAGSELGAEMSGFSGLREQIALFRKQSHEDIMLLTSISRDHEARIARLESRI